jgi:7-carboxy-7-deazaguanine synthase
VSCLHSCRAGDEALAPAAALITTATPTHVPAVNATLKVSEVFDSLQGEGPSLGQPCAFLRLAGCNLRCTWCDTKYTWDWEHYSYAENVRVTEVRELRERLSPASRLVITGGEPLLQQAGLIELLGSLPGGMFVEVETNGTRSPSDELLDRVNQWNVSPKLSGSGETRERRLCLDVLTRLKSTQRATLKLVVGSEAEVEEARELVATLGWPLARVQFMPQASSRAALLERMPETAKWALGAGVGFSPRLHLLLWDGERAR